jgi:hypothetical protein
LSNKRIECHDHRRPRRPSRFAGRWRPLIGKAWVRRRQAESKKADESQGGELLCSFDDPTDGVLPITNSPGRELPCFPSPAWPLRRTSPFSALNPILSALWIGSCATLLIDR